MKTPLPPSAGCGCTASNNCGECLGQPGSQRCSTAMAPLPRTILAERVSVAGDEHNADFPPAMMTRSPFGDRLSGESGDTLGLPTMAFPSESMLGYLDRLKECGCITPLLQRIRGLQQSLRERLEAEEKLQARSDAQDDHCQRLKDRLAEWSQATSFFEEQKCKLGAQLHRVGCACCWLCSFLSELVSAQRGLSMCVSLPFYCLTLFAG